MSDYLKTKEKMDKICAKYSCKGDVIVSTTLLYLMEGGTQRLTDDEFINTALKNIDDAHDKAEAEGKTLFISRDFEKAIIECAAEFAHCDTRDLIMYIQREIWFYGNDYGELSYANAIRQLQRCISFIVDTGDGFGYDDLIGVGFDDSEIEYLGFENLLEEE